VNDSIRISASLPFGIVINVRSRVRKRVERKPMRSTLATKSSIFTKSPSMKG
jgi:hypothetical protein